MAVIRSSTTVKVSTAIGAPASVATTPAAPSRIAGCAALALEKNRARVATVATARAPLTTSKFAAAVVGAQDDVGGQHREQTVEVASAGRLHERVDDLPVGGGRVAVCPLDAAPR
jgi:hypothetical protein